MKHIKVGAALGLCATTFLAGCATEYAGYAEYEGDEADTEARYGSAQQSVNACAGDDLQYDFNGFSASLAVAIANELGHWDVATDFIVSNGKLALSSAGNTRCGTGCANVKDLLLLQEDSTAGIPNHSPSVLRTKLTVWYQAQMDKQVELATAAAFPPGVYRFKGRQSTKYMVVDNGSTVSGALVEQKGTLIGTNGDWEVSVVGTKHKLKNVKSGMCLDLKVDGPANTDMVQKQCSTATSQLFKMSAATDASAFYIETRHAGKALTVNTNSTQDDAKIVQVTLDKNQYSSQFLATSVNGTPISGLFKGMYTLAATHGSKVLGVANNSENTAVAQYTASATNPMLNWYSVPMGSNKYQFVNRSSGLCLALASDSATAKAVQKTCANNDSQKFTVAVNGAADTFTLLTRYNVLLEVTGHSMVEGATVGQASTTNPDPQRKFKMTPLLAGEPHKLTFSHKTADAACGDYFWYNITSPNGLPLSNPAETFIQLIFAGGKKVMGGADENPFIAQLATGTQVAIDPSGYMLPGGQTSTGSCVASDVFYDPTKLAAGAAGPPVLFPLCCTKYTGATGGFKVSTWSSTTFVCN